MLLKNLRTDRLRFRRLNPDDQAVLTEFFQSEKATRLITIFENPARHAQARIEYQMDRYDKEGDGLCAIIDRHSGELVGHCGLLWQEIDDVRELEVAYHLQPKHWKKGYASEAAMACRDFVFAQGLAESVISIIDTENINSQKVAERNGMQREKEVAYKGRSVYIYRIKKK